MGDWISALRWVLLQSIWQIILIATILWLVLKLIPCRKANLRYMASMVALLIIPLSFIANLFNFFNSTIELTQIVYVPANRLIILFEALPLVPVWFVGILLIFFRILHDKKQIKAIAAQPKNNLNGELVTSCTAICRTLNITKKVTFGINTHIVGPCTFGFFKPVVLLPISCLSNLISTEIQAILAHELAHIKRADFLQKHIQAFIEALFFYHPLAKYISLQISKEREHACDDLAVSVLGKPINLARGLLKSGIIAYDNTLLLGGGVLGKEDLSRRVKRLITTPKSTKHTHIITLSTISCIALLISGIQFSSLAKMLPPIINMDYQMLALDHNEIVELKNEICDQFTADGIYQDPKYGGRVAANVIFSKNMLLMNGQELPQKTSTAIREILIDHKITQKANGHLRFYGSDVALLR